MVEFSFRRSLRYHYFCTSELAPCSSFSRLNSVPYRFSSSIWDIYVLRLLYPAAYSMDFVEIASYISLTLLIMQTFRSIFFIYLAPYTRVHFPPIRSSSPHRTILYVFSRYYTAVLLLLFHLVVVVTRTELVVGAYPADCIKIPMCSILFIVSLPTSSWTPPPLGLTWDYQEVLRMVCLGRPSSDGPSELKRFVSTRK